MRLLKLLVCLALGSSFTVVAFAHPGRTDSNGGHIDHSTGEYHYHHGYSAHQHYDIDGDGYADCPYNFDDRTGSSSGGNSTENHPMSSSKTDPPPKSIIRSLENDDQLKETPVISENTKSFWDYIFDGCCILLELYVVVGCAWGFIRFIKWIFGR